MSLPDMAFGASLQLICLASSTSPITFRPLSKRPIIDNTEPAWLSDTYAIKLNTRSIIVFTREILPSCLIQRVQVIISISKTAITNLPKNCVGIALLVRLILASLLPLTASFSSLFPSFTLNAFVTLIP